MKTIQKNFLGPALKGLRGVRSQSQIARELGVPQQTYANWENGSRQPKLDDLRKIALHFEVSADFLLGLPQRLPRGGVTDPATNRGGVKDAATNAELQDIRKSLAALVQRVEALSSK